jgi:uncharacterized protein YgbK (DUF1537 family)
VPTKRPPIDVEQACSTFTVTLVGGNPGETLDASGNEHGSPAVVADPIVEEKGRHLFVEVFNSGWSGGCVESPASTRPVAP